MIVLDLVSRLRQTALTFEKLKTNYTAEYTPQHFNAYITYIVYYNVIF